VNSLENGFQIKKLTRAFIHEPYKMTYLDQKFNDFEVGVNIKTYREYGKNTEIR
jgi:hypothetical protein